jgi:hypothetical protein
VENELVGFASWYEYRVAFIADEVFAVPGAMTAAAVVIADISISTTIILAVVISINNARMRIDLSLRHGELGWCRNQRIVLGFVEILNK